MAGPLFGDGYLGMTQEEVRAKLLHENVVNLYKLPAIEPLAAAA